MEIKITLSEILIAVLLLWVGFVGNTWAFLWFVVYMGILIFNPKWSKKKGWSFGHKGEQNASKSD